MTAVIIILSVAVVFAFAGLIFFWRKGSVKEKRYREEIERIRSEKQNSGNDDLKWYEEKVKSFENRISDLNERIEEKQEQIKRYNDIIKDLNEKNIKLSIAYSALEITVTTTREEFDKLNQAKFDTLEAQKHLDEAIQASKTAASECEKDVEILKKELEDLKEQKRLAILYQDEDQNDLWDFSITPKENELISILERINTDYPELKMDISNIEWKRIWLTKIQDMTNEHELAGRKGIYRLILKSDKDVCYVGQAVNIKDRWYQHIKKMIGVDVKGNEKVYNYRPEDFYWTIVEYDCKDLNDREHYWIEYFGCKEKGLNRKA